MSDPEVPKETSNGGNDKHLYHFTAYKAGMEKVDRARIDRIIHEASRNSAHYKNEARKAAEVSVRIKRVKRELAALPPSEREKLERDAVRLRDQLDAERDDLDRVWIAVDMDQFYAAIAMRDNPKLRNLPVAVGGHAMISTANYVARRFGVRSAMPGFIAKKLCPQLVFVAHDFDATRTATRQTRAIFAEYDAEFEAMSGDEAALDVTDFCRRTGRSGAEVAQEIRQRIQQVTKLTASAGVACTKMLAKMCSEVNKPNGQHEMPTERTGSCSRADVRRFLEKLPVRKVPGIGRVAERVLNEFGITVCGDVFKADRLWRLAYFYRPKTRVEILRRLLGATRARHCDASAYERKSISCERSFRPDENIDTLLLQLRRVARNLAADCKKSDTSGQTITLKVKTADFRIRSRARQLAHCINTEEELFLQGESLLRGEMPLKIRLLGLRLSNLGGKDKNQASLEQFFRADGGLRADEDSPSEDSQSEDSDVGDFGHRDQDLDKDSVDRNSVDRVGQDQDTDRVDQDTDRVDRDKDRVDQDRDRVDQHMDKQPPPKKRRLLPQPEPEVRCPICNTLLQGARRLRERHVERCLGSTTNTAKVSTAKVDTGGTTARSRRHDRTRGDTKKRKPRAGLSLDRWFK